MIYLLLASLLLNGFQAYLFYMAYLVWKDAKEELNKDELDREKL